MTVTTLRMVIAAIVTCVWAGGCTIAFLSKDPGLIGLATVITPVMLAVVGWLTTQEFLDRKRNGNGKTAIKETT